MQVGEDTRENGAVDQGIPEPRRGLGPIARGPELTVRVPYHVDCGQEEPVWTGALRGDAGPQEGGVPEYQLGGNQPAGHQPAIAVDVGDYGIEEGDPLGHGGLERLPLGLVDHQRTGVERPGLPPALDGAAHVVGGPLVAEEPGQLVPSGQKTVRSQRGQLHLDLFPPGPDGAVRAEVLVCPSRDGRIGSVRPAAGGVIGPQGLGGGRGHEATESGCQPTKVGRKYVSSIRSWTSARAACTSSRNSVSPLRVSRGTAADATTMDALAQASRAASARANPLRCERVSARQALTARGNRSSGRRNRRVDPPWSRAGMARRKGW